MTPPQPPSRVAARDEIVPRAVRLLEPWTVLALAAHAVAVEMVSAWTTAAVVAVVILAALGGTGLAGWQSRSAVVFRFAVVVGLAFALMALQGEGSGYFLLWMFVVAAVYPLVLPGLTGAAVAVVVPAVYLALVPLGAADGPLPVALVRALCLVLIAVVVHASSEALRDAAVARADAVAVLDTFGDVAPIGMALVNNELRFVLSNPVFTRMCGWRDGELPGRPVDEIGALVPGLVHHLERVRDGHPAPPLEVMCAGRWWTLQLFAVPGSDGPLGTGIAAIDITEQREAARALAHSATHDALTGLPNRALLADRLEVEVARAARRREPIAVLFCDLDRFKDVNDSLGHAAGDELLRATGERLRHAVRTGDTVARLGGDEFAVLCGDLAGTADAVAVAERIRELVRAPLRIADRELSVTMSIGVTAGVPEGTGAAELLADADVAMYEAKDAGRDRVAVFDPGQRAGARQRFELHAALREAVERDLLEVAYQPVVALDPLRVVGVEALARWTWAGGPVSPSTFVPMAEDLGLIDELTRQVVDQAVGAVQRWRSELWADLVLSVNLSPRQLAEPGAVAMLGRILAEHGLPATAVQVEITESALMADVAAAGERLEELRELGVRIALDDFGTGYSSLALLRDLPVDVLKVDQSFTARLPQDVAMVGFMVDLARAVGATVVVEGVETPEQLDALRPLGCDAVQGFGLWRPLTAEALRGVLLEEATRAAGAGSA
ncbi:MAG: EAL domain-containing protein [Actinomycetales bacterium]|nr:EAL domain-containing protein [Actinomycetales bacterium]